jgi:hypothetical protein
MLPIDEKIKEAGSLQALLPKLDASQKNHVGPNSNEAIPRDSTGASKTNSEGISTENLNKLQCVSNTQEGKKDTFIIRESALSGNGAFALRDLVKGEEVLVERALFHAHKSTLYNEFDKLSLSDQKAFRQLHAYFPSPNTDQLYAIFRTNRLVLP